MVTVAPPPPVKHGIPKVDQFQWVKGRSPSPKPPSSPRSDQGVKEYPSDYDSDSNSERGPKNSPRSPAHEVLAAAQHQLHLTPATQRAPQTQFVRFSWKDTRQVLQAFLAQNQGPIILHTVNGINMAELVNLAKSPNPVRFDSLPKEIQEMVMSGTIGSNKTHAVLFYGVNSKGNPTYVHNTPGTGLSYAALKQTGDKFGTLFWATDRALVGSVLELIQQVTPQKGYVPSMEVKYSRDNLSLFRGSSFNDGRATQLREDLLAIHRGEGTINAYCVSAILLPFIYQMAKDNGCIARLVKWDNSGRQEPAPEIHIDIPNPYVRPDQVGDVLKPFLYQAA